MAPCRSCRRGAILGPSQQLAKRRHGSNIPLVIDMPNYTGLVKQDVMHKHAPNLFHYAREAGDRVVRPYEYFQQSFTNTNDPWLHTKALDWVFTRLEIYGQYPYHFTPILNIPDLENPFKDLMARLVYFNRSGDVGGMQQTLSVALSLFETVSKVIRADRGMGWSDQLLFEYFEEVKRFIRWFAEFDTSSAVFDLLKSVWKACLQDLTPAIEIMDALNTRERSDLFYVALEWAARGDIFASLII
ncbi:hypothetical protein B0J14DRAFT_361127 [Halenospora varia]|nr:hypothetical protein B0J14DRAFT_361127 [Halenospora varia]